MVDKGKISKLSLSKLIELQKISQEILTKYQNELANYSRLNNDPKFEIITETEKKKISKCHIIREVIDVINNLIEENVLSYYKE